MQGKHKTAIDEGLNWVNNTFEPVAVIVSGSIIRGNPNENSDLDIFVIHEKEFRQRVQKFFNNIPCEILVNNYSHVYGYFEKELKSNRPVTAHLISTGKIYFGEETDELKNLVSTAKEYLTKTPEFNEKVNIKYTYLISGLFEDATDTMNADRQTSLFFLNKMIGEIIEFVFLKNNVPLPRSKERIKYMVENFPELGKLTVEFYVTEPFNKKYEIARQIVLMTIGETGFFEWDSGPE